MSFSLRCAHAFTLVCACLTVLISTPTFASETLAIRHRVPDSKTDTRFIYRIELIKLAMEKTIEEGSYRLVPTIGKMTHRRVIESLMRGRNIDIVSFPTNIEREKKLLPIRFPILKGLLGYRIFFINRKDRQKFADIKSFTDLQELKAGIVSHWSDVEIMRRGEIPLVEGSTYEGIWGMLTRNRFDYFPRGVNEIWGEAEDIKEDYPGIVIEDKVAMYYPLVTYFFVGKHNTKLAGRMERGLLRAYEDGSFEKIFMKYNGQALTQARLDKRLLFKLKNYPSLPDKIPFDIKGYWIDPTKPVPN